MREAAGLLLSPFCRNPTTWRDRSGSDASGGARAWAPIERSFRPTGAQPNAPPVTQDPVSTRTDGEKRPGKASITSELPVPCNRRAISHSAETGKNVMNLIVLLIILIILFGGGGFYLGGPYVGGGLGTVLLIVLIVLLVRGG